MLRYYFSAIFYFSFLPQILVGAPIQLIGGVPNSYVPGQPVTFDVLLPAISNLGSYNIDLVLESTTGTAGVDFFFDIAATEPASEHYVFPSPANFFDAANVDSSARHRMTLTDFDFAGVNVVPGMNDRVASVVLQTTAGFAGQLALSVDTDGLILDTPAVDPTAVTGFDAIKTGIAESGPVELEPVPEPSPIALLLLAVAGGCVPRSTACRVSQLIRG